MRGLKSVLALLMRSDSLARVPGGRLYAVNYHSIGADELGAFRRHMDLLRKAGFESCHPSHLRSVLSGISVDSSKRVLISFDDGFANNLRAAEVLEQLGWVGWFFVPAATATGQTEHLRTQFPAQDFMTARDLRDLISRGHSVGAHGFDHVRLSDRVDDRTRVREVVSSRHALEQCLGERVRYFCWIGGEVDSYGGLAYRLIRDTYEGAFTTFAQPITPGQSPYFMDRTNLKPDYTDAEVALACSTYTRMRHLWRKRQVVRRLEAALDRHHA